MEKNKEIKVYGTLTNWTVDDNKKGVDPISGVHYDAVAYADQLYDKWFGEVVHVNNFQDIINRRVTAIKYGDGTTTIENRDGVNPLADNPYVLKVIGSTNIDGSLYLGGTLYVRKNGQWVPIDLVQLKEDVEYLKNKFNNLQQQIQNMGDQIQNMGNQINNKIENLEQQIGGINIPESLWKEEGSSLVPVDSSRSVKAFGFYDTDPQMI